MTTRHRGTVLTDKAAQAFTEPPETARPTTTTGPRTKTAQRQSGGVAYASAAQLSSLAEYLAQISEVAKNTGWHSPNMIVSLGDGDEAIVVGVRWLDHMGGYVAEIR